MEYFLVKPSNILSSQIDNPSKSLSTGNGALAEFEAESVFGSNDSTSHMQAVLAPSSGSLSSSSNPRNEPEQYYQKMNKCLGLVIRIEFSPARRLSPTLSALRSSECFA